DFFELGGHSLQAVQLVSHVFDKINVSISLRDIFAHKTIRNIVTALGADVRSGTKKQALPTIQKQESQTLRELSAQQERLYFLEQLQGATANYNIFFGLNIQGQLDSEIVAQCLEYITTRHEVLRSTFINTAQGAYQKISENNPGWTLECEQVQASQIDSHIKVFAGQEFPLADECWLRVKLLTVSPQRQVLLFLTHHIVSDGWSIGILVKEFCQQYRAKLSGHSCNMDDLPVQYSDYAYWQKQIIADTVNEQLDYWRTELQDAPQLLELGIAQDRNDQVGYDADAIPIKITSSLSAELNKLARSQNTTLSTVLLATLQLLLSRYAGQTDINVGIPVANRRKPEVEKLIGYFLNTLVIRVKVDENKTLKDYLGHVHERCLSAFEHQDVPFEKVLEAINPQRTTNHTPLYQVMFILQNTPSESIAIPGVNASALAYHHDKTTLDMTFDLTESDEGISGYLVYRKGLYQQKDVAQLLENYVLLLSKLADNLDSEMCNMPSLSKVQFNDIREFSSNGVRLPVEGSLASLFCEQVARTPHTVALQSPDKAMSFVELDRLSNQFAHYLSHQGIAVGDRVGLRMERGIDMIVSMLGVIKLGASYLPLHDQLNVQQIENIAVRAELNCVVSKDVMTTLSLVTHTYQHFMDQLQSLCDESLAVNFSNLLPAHLYLTSGTTGMPKIVIGSHYSVVNNLVEIWHNHPIGDNECVLAKTSPSFIASVQEVFAPLLKGGKLFFNSEAQVKDITALLELIEQQKVTRVFFTPSVLRLLFESQNVDKLSSLKRIFVGGEAINAELVQKVKATMAHVVMVNAYGSTEVVGDATASRLTDIATPKGVMPIGKPVANLKVYILDQYYNLCPPGVVGELYVSGPSLATAYVDMPDLTAASFVPDPFSSESGQRMYRLGDLGKYNSQGEVLYLGRRDNQIQYNGIRIELSEIERLILLCPLVQGAICRHIVDENDDQALKAVIKVVDPQRDNAPVRQHISRHIPSYMVPNQIVLVTEYPVTSNGKVDTKALLSFQEQVTDSELFSECTTPTEQAIAGVWQDILLLETVGSRQSFFELGGNSLSLSKVHVKLVEQLGMEVTMMDLFSHPTVESLAHFITNKSHNETGEKMGSTRGKRQAIALQQSEAMRRHRQKSKTQSKRFETS
ncbi:amino acid adenylation domain-containing protein, partial [Pseudoalteromonas sp. MMG013]|uniref:non-ribosomal peptide synthetase n=1 Tax=Pseudoalteromonas sp. MMG013 TaxID=2822687 RepID=UPI001B35BF2B